MSSIRITWPTMPFALGSSLGAGNRSSTMGRTPASASSHATINPFGPAPEITTGTWVSGIDITFRAIRPRHRQSRDEGVRYRAPRIGIGIRLHHRFTDRPDDRSDQSWVHIASRIGPGTFRDRVDPIGE